MENLQVLIEKAWGDFWQLIKGSAQHLDQYGGLANYALLSEDMTLRKLREYVRNNPAEFFIDRTRIYPKALEGLRHNNGWTVIYGVHEVPTDNGTYWLVGRRSKKVAKRSVRLKTKTEKLAFAKRYSHHLSANKPQPPLHNG